MNNPIGSLVLAFVISWSIPYGTLSQSQSKDGFATFSGHIADALTGEPLAGASFTYSNTNTGVVSNPYGFFSLTNQKGSEKTITASYLGYASLTFKFSFKKDSLATLFLQPATARRFFYTGLFQR